MDTSRSLISRIITTLVSIIICVAYRIDAQASPAEDADKDAGVLLSSEQYDEAIKRYTTAISLDPKLIYAYEGRGVAYERSNRWREAIDDFTKELELDPKHAAAYCARAEAYEQLGNYKKAIDDFTQAIANSPCSYYFSKRADLYEKIGEHQLAEEDKVKLAQVQNAEHMAEIDRWSLAITKNPKDADAYNWRGITYFQMGHYPEAVNDISRALSITQDDSAASDFPNFGLFCRGQAYAAMGNYDNAITDYDQYIASTDVHPHGLNVRLEIRMLQDASIKGRLRRGEAYLALKRWKPALDDFTCVIAEFHSGESQNPVQNHPWLASAYQGRAQVYEGQGNDKLAGEDFERAKQCGYFHKSPNDLP